VKETMIEFSCELHNYKELRTGLRAIRSIISDVPMSDHDSYPILDENLYMTLIIDKNNSHVLINHTKENGVQHDISVPLHLSNCNIEHYEINILLDHFIMCLKWPWKPLKMYTYCGSLFFSTTNIST
jgi:hypothetical protein